MPSKTPTDISPNVPKKFPTDSYAAVEPQVMPATDPPDDSLDESSTQTKHHTSWLERFLHLVFLLLLALAVLGSLVWLDHRLHTEVVLRQPIGQFQRMSGPGGLQGNVVIETDTGSYPLRGTPAIAKGTLLVMEARASGYRYICDAPRSLCIETTGKEFKSSVPTQAPSSISDGTTP